MSPRLKNFPRSGARALTHLLLALAFVFAAQSRAEAAGSFVPAPGRVDMVYDSARDTLYITSGASVLRYHLATNSFLAPFDLGGSLSGLDLSPDGDTLVVADRARTEANLWVHIVDLNTGASRKANFTRTHMEGGTFSVAYGSDDRVLVTSTFEGSGWVPLRRLDPATGQWTTLDHLLSDSLGDLSQDAMLAASGDRTVVGFAEANISDGRWGSYKVANGSLAHRTGYTDGTSWFNYEMGVNSNGTQYAVPTYGGAFVYNSTYGKVATLGQYAGAQPVGVVYHPVEDLVYFPWATTNEVRAFDTNTFAQVAAYNFEDTFQNNGNRAFQQGRMKMSRDGSLLFATVTGGVRFVRLYAPLTVHDIWLATAENTPAEVILSGSVGNGGALSYHVVTPPAHGSLSGSGASLVYTPAPNYSGPDSFTYKGVYGPAETAAATVSIDVTPNSGGAPTADDQSVAVDEDGSVAVALTGSDPEGSPVTFEVADGPAYGSLSGTAPNLVYTPAPNFFGGDSFTFRVSDGATAGVGRVNVTVNSVNDAPVVAGRSLATDEDAPLPVRLTADDVDNSPLYFTFTVISPPAHGSLSGSGANLVYTPDPNYHGPDSFGFKVTDGESESNDAAVNINVRPVNDAPTAEARTVMTDEDAAAAVVLSGSDADGDAVSFAVVSAPAHGALSGTAPNLVYTPAANYNGGDSFTYKTSDGSASSPAATVAISVASINDTPTAVAKSLTTKEDTAAQVTLSGSDPDGDTVGYVVVTSPAHGSLSGTGANLVYTPSANYNGPDSFAYKASDGSADSAAATVNVNVTPVNDSPVISDMTLATDEDTSVPLTLTGTDVDGDTVYYYVGELPKHGNLSGTAPNYTYNPLPNFYGTDTFTYRANDGSFPPTATVTVTVRPAEDAPKANRQNLTGTEDTAMSIVLTGSDPDGDALTYSVTSGPARGTLSGTAPNLVYTPAQDFYGTDNFAFTVSDGKSAPSTERVYLTLGGVNDAPTAAPQAVTTNEDTSKYIFLYYSDPDGNPMTVTVVSGPAHGALSGSGSMLTYTPAADYHGPDPFTYKVNDGTVDSNVATVDITVAPVNDAPVSSNLTVATGEDTPGQLVLSASDAEGDAVRYTVALPPAHGSLSGTAPNLVYTPAPNYSGPDSFTYVASDPQAQGPVATVSINVAAVNDAPSAMGQSLATNEDTARLVYLSGSDVENNPLTYAVVSAPAHGALSGAAPNMTYTPAPNYSGHDSFTFRVNDGAANSNVATININVVASNDTPTANGQALATNEDTAQAVTLTASDVDGDPLAYVLVAAPQHGALTGVAPNLTYKPALNYNGPDSFTFRVDDGKSQSATATVAFNVVPVNDAPTAGANTATVVRNSAAVNIAVLSNDGDVDGDALTVISVQPSSNGAVTIATGGQSVNYKPRLNYRGTDLFTYTVSDGRGGSATATVTVTVK